MNKRSTHIYRSLTQPRLLMGWDRELLMSLFIICSAIVASSLSLAGVLCAALAFAVGFPLLYCMGQRDPLWRHVFLRAIRYQDFYVSKRILNKEKS